jgi:Z1 domain
LTQASKVIPVIVDQPSAQLSVGQVTDDLLARVAPEGARDQLESEAVRVLSRCRAPHERAQGELAQLVVGRVQSGKTLSFTSVIALARDNGYPLVVVLAGTKKNLLEQTINRLQDDLRLNGDGGPNVWRHLINPSADDKPAIIQALESWRPDVPERFRQTAVLFVLKHASRLQTAAETLKDILTDPRLAGTPALIVDDEADQASLNTRAGQGAESSVYSALRELRTALTNHSFLMYTATPQAPLLVSLADTISPDKVTVLAGGDQYVGGEELFLQRRGEYVREIEGAELSLALDPDGAVPPPSLADALATFLIALVVAQRRGKPRPLSMLIHPAHTRDLHKRYDHWTTNILASWRIQLRHQDDPAYLDLREAVFREPFNDLLSTCEDLADDNDCLDGLLKEAYFYLGQIEQRVVNSATGHEIRQAEWGQFPGWIVIGGNKLDRGFTLTNLAVTYMPRGQGVGNADTLQQRGRFFGYKRAYLDLLRGWFTEDVAKSFAKYVRHEKAMHVELLKIDASNESLKSWRRRFLLDPAMKLTRQQVISLDTQGQVVAGWAFRQTGLYEPSLSEANSALQARLVHWLQAAVPHPDDRRKDRQHVRTMVDGADVLRLLEEWAAVPEEKDRLDQLTFAFAHWLDDGPRTVELIGMDGLGSAARHRDIRPGPRPSSVQDWRINGLFQGRAPKVGYPGDDKFFSPDHLTLQLHVVQPYLEKQQIGEEAPALAVFVTDEMATRVTAQVVP